MSEKSELVVRPAGESSAPRRRKEPAVITAVPPRQVAIQPVVHKPALPGSTMSSTSSPLPIRVNRSDGVTPFVAGNASDEGGSGVQSVEVRLDAESWQPAEPHAPGDWSRWSLGLSVTQEGPHRLEVRATDAAANQVTAEFRSR